MKYSPAEFERMFREYLEKDVKLRIPTINEYMKNLNLYITEKSIELKSVTVSFFEIQDIDSFNSFYDNLKNNVNFDFKNENRKKFSHYSAPLGNYEKFIKKLSSSLNKITTETEPDIIVNPMTQRNNGNNKSENINSPLNQILFGPPGTGKTYNTVNRALEIIGENIKGKSRQEIKRIFDTKIKDGQIVFTTFHQSMCYEDFIEGIKPIEPEKDGDSLIYRVVTGIFRNLCVEASFEIAQLRESKTTEEVLDFSILYDNFVESVDEKISNGQEVELDMKSGVSVMVESISQQRNFIIKHHNGKQTYTVSKARLTKLHLATPNLDDVTNIHEHCREKIGGCNSSAYWSVLNAIRNQKPIETSDKESHSYTFDEKRDVVISLTNTDYKNKSGKPYVLIIDEINRGNISQIFGELITLIEDDKRLGREEALEVTLPYSKEKFGVPSNLYIIGTMNTADRSVEALDAALRRRFSFIEMPPLPELIAKEGKLTDGMLSGIELQQLLIVINRRIEKLLDKDHLIGHSYFMNISNVSDLKLRFINKIIPLMQEYFFGDYGKIGLVLGKGFFDDLSSVNENIFADFYDYNGAELSEKIIYKFKDIKNMPDADFISALKLLILNK